MLEEAEHSQGMSACCLGQLRGAARQDRCIWKLSEAAWLHTRATVDAWVLSLQWCCMDADTQITLSPYTCLNLGIDTVHSDRTVGAEYLALSDHRISMFRIYQASRATHGISHCGC